MEQLLYSFNSYTIVLSSPPPLSSQLMVTNAIVKGVTKISLDYSLLNFTVSPYKVILNWPGQDATVINSEFTNLSTFTIANTALSYTVFSSKSPAPTTVSPSFVFYYQNGIIHTFTCIITAFSDNVIDMDLNVLDIQNAYEPFSTVYNLQSNRDNVVFNLTDITSG